MGDGAKAADKRARVSSDGISADAFVHESSYVDEDVVIGEGTTVWHFCHIQSGARIGKRCSMGQNLSLIHIYSPLSVALWSFPAKAADASSAGLWVVAIMGGFLSCGAPWTPMPCGPVAGTF